MNVRLYFNYETRKYGIVNLDTNRSKVLSRAGKNTIEAIFELEMETLSTTEIKKLKRK